MLRSTVQHHSTHIRSMIVYMVLCTVYISKICRLHRRRIWHWHFRELALYWHKNVSLNDFNWDVIWLLYAFWYIKFMTISSTRPRFAIPYNQHRTTATTTHTPPPKQPWSQQMLQYLIQQAYNERWYTDIHIEWATYSILRYPIQTTISIIAAHAQQPILHVIQPMQPYKARGDD